jgi:hypothetical protein
MTLNNEQLEELAAALRGTDQTLAEALLVTLGITPEEDYDEDHIEDELSNEEETMRCLQCNTWVLIGSMSLNSMDDPVCPDCDMLNKDDDE